LAGDARWVLHDVAGAQAEFTAALEADLGSELRQLLTARAASTGAFVDSLRRAEATGERNGRLVWLAVAVFAAVVWVLLRRAAPAVARA
jgi:hypothetical protein